MQNILLGKLFLYQHKTNHLDWADKHVHSDKIIVFRHVAVHLMSSILYHSQSTLCHSHVVHIIYCVHETDQVNTWLSNQRSYGEKARTRPLIRCRQTGQVVSAGEHSAQQTR